MQDYRFGACIGLTFAAVLSLVGCGQLQGSATTRSSSSTLAADDAPAPATPNGNGADASPAPANPVGTSAPAPAPLPTPAPAVVPSTPTPMPAPAPAPAPAAGGLPVTIVINNTVGTPAAPAPAPVVGSAGSKTTVVSSDVCSTPDCVARAKISKSVQQCLANWGGLAPFSLNSPYRQIGVSVNVLGFGNNVDDSNITAAPELVVIGAAVSVLSLTSYRLMNPNGWYCLVADVNVAALVDIDLQTSAHLADARVNVNILSLGASAGVVGVNVLSNVHVSRSAN